ncbi:MAG: 50S ribosomal protein L13 [Patescibacteria group bacterium]|nr:50S ribosomal protein L13 [Patescibacteria group bacterium]
MDYTIDAHNKRLGHLASKIAVILQGKDSAAYEPNKVGDNRVLLTNYKDISFSTKKAIQKVYYHHTGYMGHLRKKTLQQEWDRDPKHVVREAVRKMLPKNLLSPRRIKNLVFVD